MRNMRLSWKVAILAALSSAAEGNAFVSTNYHNAQPSSALGMTRRRSLMPLSRSLLGPPSFFREMDQVMEDSFAAFDNFFDAPLAPTSPFSLLTERANRLPDLAVVQRPRATYKINQDKDKVELIVNIPGAKVEDIDAKLEKNGRVIRLSGISRTKENGISIESRFERAFMLGRMGERFDENEITAKLSDGILTITAPKIVEEADEVRNIMITEETAALPAKKEKDVERKTEDAVDADEPKAEAEVKEKDTPEKNIEDGVDVNQLKEESKVEEKDTMKKDAENGDDLDDDAIIEL